MIPQPLECLGREGMVGVMGRVLIYWALIIIYDPKINYFLNMARYVSGL